MNAAELHRIRNHPSFIALERQRNAFSWSLAGIMVAIYGGFILLVALRKDLAATRLGAGVITLGLPLGLAVILVAIGLTGLYVWRANTRFDALAHAVRGELS